MKSVQLKSEMLSFILIAEEFPSHSGGVAYFSDVLAKRYHSQGQLKGVISISSFIPEPREFKVNHIILPSRNYGSMPLDHIVPFRKINSAIFKLKNRLSGSLSKPILEALAELNYDPLLDVLFFTYQVHFPNLFTLIHQHFNGKQWILYHGLDLLGYKRSPEIITRTCDVANKVFFNSNATLNLFTELGFKSKNTEILHPFLDTPYLKQLKLEPLEQLEKKLDIEIKGSIVITSICRLVKRKGIHFAVEMIKSLINKGFKIKYLIAGDGPESENLKKLVSREHLENNIFFLGYVDDIMKYSLLHISKVFLMPNYDDGGTDFEGFGISFLEAGYYDNLVVGGNHGGSVEALDLIEKSISFNPERIDDRSNTESRIIKYLENEI